MSDYLHESLSPNVGIQLTSWLTDEQSKNLSYWVIADGVFAPHQLTPMGATKWQPVFTHEPMSLYEEMGLFMSAIPTEPLRMNSFIDSMRSFDGRPMLTIVASHLGDEVVRQFLTWITDAHTSDGLSVYLRVGDSRCLPSILKSLEPEQKKLVLEVMYCWTWFGRDGNLKIGMKSNIARSKLSDEALKIMQKPLIISEPQYIKLVEAGEVDLIHSTIMEIDSSIYPQKVLKHKIFILLSKFIEEAKSLGIKDINEIKNHVLDRLVQGYDKKS